jgi:uncharacterized protein YjbJ (UPF0337 family)
VNKNQIKGAAKEAGGKIQKEFGKAVDSPKHTIEGAAKEVVGKTQKAVGDAQEEVRRERKDANKDADRRGW